MTRLDRPPFDDVFERLEAIGPAETVSSRGTPYSVSADLERDGRRVIIARPRAEGGESLTLAHKVLFSVAVIALAAYSGIWWQAQRRIGNSHRRELTRLDGLLGVRLNEDRGGLSDKVGGLYTIVLLAVVAVVSLWLPPR